MSKKLKKFEDIRVVVGLDFGTTFSGFTYCHVEDRQNMSTNETWPGQLGQFKTNTVLEYDDDLDKVVLWGYPALTKRPSRNKEKNKRKNVVELFKLHLGNLSPKLRNELSVDYKKAITDYLGEIGKCVEETIDVRWKGMKLENVLFILTVPAEYDDKAIRIMRECMSDAKLIDDLYSERLQFTTEPEAAAIYCMENNLKEHDLTDSGTTFMIVDCGGGTVDLTTRKLLNRKQLGEVTERTGDYCGNAFRDHVDNISVPQSPTAAISRGAAMYGLSLYNGEDPSIRKGSKSVIGSRVLKNTYGVDVLRPWSPGDPKERVGLSFFGPSTLYFNIIAKRGTVAKIDDVFPTEGLTNLVMNLE
ncbi:unnamed protein product [Rhizophagus irregularis]|nr:unnamed protein product [Rhizophagus irregularis]